MLKKIFIVCSLIGTELALASQSYISKTQTLADNGSEILLGMDYFQPTLHSNEDGTVIQFDEGEAYQSADFNLLGRYGFTDRFEAEIGLRFRYILARELIEDEDTLFTKSGFESSSIGFKYSFLVEDGMQYSIEANYRAASYANDLFDKATAARETVAFGEGGTDVSLGLGLTFITKSQNFFSTKFLYRNPAEHLSSEIYSEIEGAIVWPGVTLILGLENVYSLGQDAYSTDPENKPDIDNGASQQFNSVNRSWTAPYAGVNFALGQKWRVEFKAQSKTYGISTDLGNLYSVNFIRRSESSSSFSNKNSAFKEYRYEGTVQKITKKRSAVVVDIGLKDGIKKGAKVDFYHFDYIGGNQLIATGFTVKVGLRKSVVKITKRFSKLRVQDGTVARAGIIKN